jgi:3-methyladenine DNA glycosylase AlkD
MSHSEKTRLTPILEAPSGSPATLAALVPGFLKRLERPAGTFDARRYFRGGTDLEFHNVGAVPLRRLARSIHLANRPAWSIEHAMRFAGVLIRGRSLESKAIGIEVVRRFHREFSPRLLPIWHGWLAEGYSSNWATTDAICGSLVGPLLAAHPRLALQMRRWARHRSLWVRRASAVSLVPLARRGRSLSLAYGVARALHRDREDLIEKAAGWLLREAGKTDPRRLERYLLRRGRTIPRTTLRYAIERMSPFMRRKILRSTRRGG